MDNEHYPQLYTGIEQFNEGEFFDCHDTIEDIWMENTGEERLFLQGLIQAAVAYYHKGNGNYSGAVSQLSKSLAKLEQYPERFLGVDLAPLMRTMRLHRTVFHGVVCGTYNRHAAGGIPPPHIAYRNEQN